MPMILRSRRSLHPGEQQQQQQQQQQEVEEAELQEAEPATPRRSTRLHRRATYTESDDSDSESVQSQGMERRPGPEAELEEEEEEAASETGVKYCSVLLSRVQEDDKTAKKELQEKEDMNRKGGKPLSRIPTFHKRPSGASQSPELPLPKKDPPVHVAPPQERPAPGSVEASTSKPPEVRETALAPPSVRVPKTLFESPAAYGSGEQAAAVAHSSITTAPKSLSLSGSVHHLLLTASPRPAIRPEQGAEQHLPYGDESKTSDVECDDAPDAPGSGFSHEGSLSQEPQEDPAETYEVELRGSPLIYVSGDAGNAAESVHTAEVSRVDAIMEEEAPWETQPVMTLELKESRSSSDAESEEDLTVEESEQNGLEEAEDHPEHPHVVQAEFSEHQKERAAVMEESSGPVSAETPAEVGTTRATKGSGCSGFALLCLLPTTLLLLGGFGQHVWHYGLPASVAQLTAQLELHWLEGFGLVPEPCGTDCRVHLVESIPQGLYPTSPSLGPSIANSWLHLLDKANSSVDIAAFYFSLRAGDSELADSSDSQGQKVFEHLKLLESKGVKLRIAVNGPQTSVQDTSELAATGAEVREVNLKAVTAGIIHTKVWVVDQKHFYLGSANMDWRSLSQVKEVGLSVEDCGCLAQDVSRIFGVYWSVGGTSDGSLPPYWPARLSALSSSQNPLRLKFDGVPAQVYLSSAPPQISARGRSDDLSTILSVIGDAKEFVYISVMDYLPLSQFTEPHRFWPAIDSALRAVACTGRVQVRLLVSCWQHSPGAMFTFLQSLLVLNWPPLRCDIEVKVFTVPSTPEQKKIPFARVNHAKYMVTDRVVYIGTSNWSEDYFTQTAGVGLVVNQTGSQVKEGQRTLQSRAEDLFLRDWSSQYAGSLSVDSVDVCPHGRH